MSSFEIIGIVATVVAILGGVSAITVRYMSERTARLEQSLKEQNEEHKRITNELLSKQAELIQTIGALKSTSGTGLTLKSEIENELKQLEQIVNSSSCSILVPFPLSRDSKFAFLSVLGPERDKLKKTLININKGIAGYVYKNGQGTFVNNPSSDSRWHQDVDKRIEFRTENILCLPLIFGENTIGVVQFLNKETGFSDEDLAIMSKYTIPNVQLFLKG